MKIKILEKSIRHEGAEFFQDEIRQVTDEVGTYFCQLGWAEDLDGKVETGERDPHKPQTLTVESVRQSITSPEVG